MALWTCAETAKSKGQAHEYDQYMVVVQGCYTLIIDGNRILLRAGEEYFIPRVLFIAARFSVEQERYTHLAATGQTGYLENGVFVAHKSALAKSHRTNAATCCELHPELPF